MQAVPRGTINVLRGVNPQSIEDAVVAFEVNSFADAPRACGCEAEVLANPVLRVGFKAGYLQ